MSKHRLIAIDLAKNVFQVCAMSQTHKIVFNKSLKRHQLVDFIAKQDVSDVVMEACYSSHYWGRIFEGMGYHVKLLPAQHVTPFVRGNKSDSNDAIAIAEASLRPGIIPVPIKSIEQQDIQSLHRIRERYVSHRTGLINQTRGLLSEHGIIAPLGHKAFCALLREMNNRSDQSLSILFNSQMRYIADDYYQLTDRIDEITQQLATIAKENPLCRRLLTLPGIGVINATALYSAIGNGSQFKSARELSVWLGLTPRQYSSGEKSTSGGITKRGNRYLRKQLIHGARAAISRGKKRSDGLSRWGNQLVARRGMNKASVAMASRLARLAWVLLQRGEDYRPMV